MHADRFSIRRAFRTALAIAAAVTLALLALLAPSRADDRAAALVYDVIAGEALYEDNADARRYPASLTKIMTIYITFEELASGNVKLDDQISMSAWASSRPPSKLGIKPGGTIKVRDAIKALVTRSANDVASALGEAISGSEPDFAVRMTKTARRLGMTDTVFKNASGLPNALQRTTARDLAILGVAIQRDFPQYYGVFQTRVFEFGKRRIGNHNRLLGTVAGVDGIKTGYINASGFNLVTSVRRDGRHLVAVVMGGASGGKRDARMRKLIETWLPKAQSGEPMLIAQWNDTPVAPVPRGRPSLATRFAARLKAKQGDPFGDTVLAFAAETRAALGTGAVGIEAVAATRRTTSHALQAVIAQADADALGFSAPDPLPQAPAAVVAAFAQTPGLGAPGLSDTFREGEGTDLGETVEDVVVQPADGDARFASAFATFDAETDDALQVAVANIGAPAGASTFSRGGVKIYVHRVAVIPRGRTAPVRQNLTLAPAIAAPGPAPARAPSKQPAAPAPAPRETHAAAPAPRETHTAVPAPRETHAAVPAADPVRAAAVAPTPEIGSRTVAPTAAAAPASTRRAGQESRADGPAAAPALALIAAGAPTLAETAAEMAAGMPATLPARWHVQVGAVPSREGAMGLLAELATLEPAMDKHPRVTLPVAGANGTLYRARFAGFASESDARAACQRFANHNRPCWAVSM